MLLIVFFLQAGFLLAKRSVKISIFIGRCLFTGCMQNYLYHGGPLSIENAHNYACQLFEALDFLHNKINLVHSDLKR